MKVQELYETLHNDICNESIYTLSDVEDYVPNDIKKVAEGLNPDTYRWFQVATDVYQCDDGYLGVTGVNVIFSEGMSGYDCDYEISMSEVYPTVITSFTEKESQKVDIDNYEVTKKVKLANSILSHEEIQECVNDCHVDTENLEETCMSATWIAQALKDADLVEGID